MVILSVSQLSKYFGTRCLFDRISFSVNMGDKMGIVGPNGAGKTTLFHILTRELPYDEGQLYLPSQIRIGIQHQLPEILEKETVHDYVLTVFEPLVQMEQQLRQLEESIADLGGSTTGEEAGSELADLMEAYASLTERFESQDGYSFRSAVRGVLNGLGFYGDDFDRRIATLSGGQKTRLALARLLLTKPDLLLLDEPTNHLDIESVEWLEGFLRSSEGTFLIISHDRYFLDQVTDHTLEINQCQVQKYTGSYTGYLKKKAALDAAVQRNSEKQHKEIQRQQAIVRRMKQHGTEKLANRAKSREKKLERMEQTAPVVSQAGLSSLHFRIKQSSGRMVLDAENISKSWPGEPPLFEELHFSIQRGDRVALVGPNGIGKTTLFRMAAGEIQPDQGKLTLGHQVSLGYYHQELQNLDETLKVIEELHNAYPHLNETQLRTWLGAFLFHGDEVFTPIHLLSGGEKARLSLLKLMLSRHNLLLLDEPTNHLDIPARENLESSLQAYDGTLFFISHDRYFINRIATSILEFNAGGLTHYLGNYDDYQAKKRQLQAESEETETQQNRTRQKQEKQRERQHRELSRALKAQISELESSIQEYETRLAELQELMCRPEVYKDTEQSRKIYQETAAIQESLKSLYETWEKLL
jgi:ATP-binding cassette, subfamily F, member 3